MKKLVFFIFPLLLFSCIQKRTPSDTEESTTNVEVSDSILESVALIEDDTLYNAYYGIDNYPLGVKALSVAPHHTFDCHNERIMAVANYKDTLILITDDKRMFHDISFKEDSLRKLYQDYRFYSSYEGDVPYQVFMRKKGDALSFSRSSDDNLLYLEDACISKGCFPIGPMHIGMSQTEMADSIGIPIDMTNAYNCVIFLYGGWFTLLKNMKHPKPFDGPEFEKIIISYSDIITKMKVVFRNNGGPILGSSAPLEYGFGDWE